MSDLCRRRRRIYTEHLTDARDFFAGGLLAEAPFTAADAGRLKAALADRELIDALEEILNIYVVYGVEEDLKRLAASKVLLRKGKDDPPPLDLVLGSEPPTYNADKSVTPRRAYERYFDWYIDEDVREGTSGVAAFWARYPLLAHAATTVTEHHKQNVKLACRRILDDWAQIEAAFFPGKTLQRLKKIRTTGNDFHKGGKQVLILTFDLAGGGQGRVVYKPSSVEIDCRLVGDTATVNSVSPQGYRQTTSLTELINKHNVPGPRAEGFTTKPLPTYVVLPYNRDRVADAYGYIRFLSHAPELDVEIADRQQIPQVVGKAIGKLKPAQIKSSDWIATDDEQGLGFHYQLGALMAMSMAVSLCDLHVQNVIAHRRLPHLIDLEEALKKPMTRLSETYLPKVVDEVRDPVGPELHIDDDRTTALQATWKGVEGKPAACVLYRHGGGSGAAEPVPLSGPAGTAGNRRALVRGLVDVVEALAKPACNAEAVAWVKGLDRTIARFVTMKTEEYADAGRNLYRGYRVNSVEALGTPAGYDTFARTDPGTKRNPGDKHVFFFRSQVSGRRGTWAGLVPTDTKGWSKLPYFAVEHPEHAWRDYLNCDVPSFYHRLGDRELLNSKGDVVDVAAAIKWQNENLSKLDKLTESSGRGKTKTSQIRHYFPERPIDMVVAQLQHLRDACSTPAGKAAFLNAALKESDNLAVDFTAFGNRLHATVATRDLKPAGSTAAGVK